MTSVQGLRLVITGSFGFMDIGDEAMLTEDLRYIRSDLGVPAENITLFGHDADYVSRYHEHPRAYCLSSKALAHYGEVLKMRRGGIRSGGRTFARAAMRGRLLLRPDREVKRRLSRADAALVTGGGTINTRDREGYSINRMSEMMGAFRRHRLPVFLSGQTIGPLGEYADHDAMAASIVSGADVLTVRDSVYSRRYLELIGVEPNRFLETFDDAYTLEYRNSDLPKTTEEFFASEQPVIAVNVTDYTSESFEQRAYVAQLCEWLVQSEEARVLLLSHTPRDLGRLFQIFDMCEPAVRDHLYLPDTRDWTGGQLKKAISRCKVAVGGRYHFIVFAGTSDTPFVGMAGNHYSYVKQHGFADPLGLSRFILTERQTFDLEILKARIREACGLRLDLSDRFARPSESMNLFGEWLARLAEHR